MRLVVLALKLWLIIKFVYVDSYEKVGRHCPDPVSSKFRLDRDFGALSETLEALIEAETKRGGKETEEALRELVYHKSLAAQCPPGDPVGVLAAQVINLIMTKF